MTTDCRPSSCSTSPPGSENTAGSTLRDDLAVTRSNHAWLLPTERRVVWVVTLDLVGPLHASGIMVRDGDRRAGRDGGRLRSRSSTTRPALWHHRLGYAFHDLAASTEYASTSLTLCEVLGSSRVAQLQVEQPRALLDFAVAFVDVDCQTECTDDLVRSSRRRSHRQYPRSSEHCRPATCSGDRIGTARRRSTPFATACSTIGRSRSSRSFDPLVEGSLDGRTLQAEQHCGVRVP